MKFIQNLDTIQETQNIRNRADTSEMVRVIVHLGMGKNANLITVSFPFLKDRNAFINNPANISPIVFFTTRRGRILKIGR